MTAAADATPRALGYRMPAEWEPHAATWLAWPHNRDDFPGKLQAVCWVFAEIARALHDGERVRVLVRDVAHERVARRQLRDAGVDLERVDTVLAPTNRSWTRDSLPLFVVRGRGHERRVGAVKFRFNGWARYDDHALDDAAGRRVARRFVPSFLPTGPSGRRRFVLEGGAVDVDGEGTLLATERCLLGRRCERNPGATRADNERVLREQLGARRVIWLEDGIAGDDTSGHVDDFARFVGPARVVVCREPNGADPNHAVLESAFERLTVARDSKRRHLDVVTLPMPGPVFFRGERLPASYANFYIGNEVVLVPTFNDPSDRVALGILAELFPTRRVVGVHAVDLVVGLGTLHCSTMQEPAASPGQR